MAGLVTPAIPQAEEPHEEYLKEIEASR